MRVRVTVEEGHILSEELGQIDVHQRTQNQLALLRRPSITSRSGQGRQVQEPKHTHRLFLGELLLELLRCREHSANSTHACVETPNHKGNGTLAPNIGSYEP